MGEGYRSLGGSLFWLIVVVGVKLQVLDSFIPRCLSRAVRQLKPTDATLLAKRLID